MVEVVLRHPEHLGVAAQVEIESIMIKPFIICKLQQVRKQALSTRVPAFTSRRDDGETGRRRKEEEGGEGTRREEEDRGRRVAYLGELGEVGGHHLGVG